jgi:hypothetical protein
MFPCDSLCAPSGRLRESLEGDDAEADRIIGSGRPPSLDERSDSIQRLRRGPARGLIPPWVPI